MKRTRLYGQIYQACIDENMQCSLGLTSRAQGGFGVCVVRRVNILLACKIHLQHSSEPAYAKYIVGGGGRS